MAGRRKTPPKGDPSNEYSQVFEKLVDGADDGHNEMIGLLAYGLYKAAKREWIVDHLEKNGVRPNAKECKAHADSQTPTILEGFRSQASEALAAYASAVVEEAKPGIQNEALQGSFMKAFVPSLAASFAFAAIIALLVVIAAVGGFSFPVDLRELSGKAS